MSQQLTDLLHLEHLDDDRFRVVPSVGTGFLFGGFTMAMAVTAAGATVDDSLVPMSLRCDFLGFGAWGPTDVAVERTNTSRSFATRRLRLTQGEKLVAAAELTFHRPETGVDVQTVSPPSIAPPEELEAVVPSWGTDEAIDPVEMRAARPWDHRKIERVHPYWARSRQALGEDPLRHAAALAFVSDYLVIFSPFTEGTDEGDGLSSYTLEHTVWFHRPFAADRWLLFDCVPLTQSGGRYVSRGTVHDERGVLVASFVQEGFVRPAR